MDFFEFLPFLDELHFRFHLLRSVSSSSETIEARVNRDKDRIERTMVSDIRRSAHRACFVFLVREREKRCKELEISFFWCVCVCVFLLVNGNKKRVLSVLMFTFRF